MAKSKREFIVVENAVVFTDCIEAITDDGIVNIITISGNKYTTRGITKEDILKAMGDPARKG